ncbi:MAG TPA: helix-turn-helix domain-containing protein [Kofleriaceae bacterium]|nr:helix-turn-helix domain-containing protein [Kofleriaceae bacterium]
MPRKPPAETPLYVRLPNDAVERLHRAAVALGIRKKDLVANLVTTYVDPDTHRGLSALGAMASQRRAPVEERSPMMGTYSFQPYEPPEIMNAEQAGQFLQIDEAMVIELAEAGKLPGKKLGPAWRFSRDALVQWLSTPEKR